MRGKGDQEQCYTVQYSNQLENLTAPTVNNDWNFVISKNWREMMY
jgi:hypothetical protein